MSNLKSILEEVKNLKEVTNTVNIGGFKKDSFSANSSYNNKQGSKVKRRIVCPVCNNEFMDNLEGEVVCDNCGQVIKEGD